MTDPDLPLGADLINVVARLNRWATRNARLPMPPAKARLLALVEAHQPARIGELAEADECQQPTMTAQLQRLEQSGWVSRAPDPDDSRAVQVTLTAAGQKMLAHVRQARAEAVAPAVSAMDPTGMQRLADAVDVLKELMAVAASTPHEPTKESC